MTVKPGPGVILWLADMMAESRGEPTLRELVEEMLNGEPGVRTRSTGKQPRRRFSMPKKKRKVSAYQKEFGRQLKKLKKKHPRTPVTKLMKRAHAATKRARRGK